MVHWHTFRGSNSDIFSFASLLRVGWLADVIFRTFNSISFISGGWAGDNEGLCAVEPHLLVGRSQAGLKLGTARSAGQCLTN